jgi:hypothetical protein
MNAPWHASTAVLDRFARDPAGLDAATAASVETHLVACAECRSAVARAADPSLAAGTWGAIADRIDRPRGSWFERTLQRIGLRSRTARLASATPGLRLSGLAAVAMLTTVAVVTARRIDAAGPFLVLAPIVPLASVALTFLPAADPAGETGVATPVHGTGLLLQRAMASLALALVALTAGSLLLPGLGHAPATWVLPALALSAGSLALGTWIRPARAVVAMAVAWAVVVWTCQLLDDFDRPVGDLVLFTAPGQIVALAVTAATAAVLVRRADRYATLEVAP